MLLIQVVIDVHSYGLEIASPYGWTKKKPVDLDDILKSARHAANEIGKVHGMKYKVGSAASLIYKTSGIASDWAYAELGAKCS